MVFRELGVCDMNSEIGDPKAAEDAAIDDEALDPAEETVVMDEEETVVLEDHEATDNVGDVSVEINVEELVAEIEANEDKEAHRKKEIRQKLEDLAEEKSFEDTYAIDLDEQAD